MIVMNGGNIQPQTRLRGLKHARETSKIAPGCLERTSLFKLHRNAQISEFRTFSIFEKYKSEIIYGNYHRNIVFTGSNGLIPAI